MKWYHGVLALALTATPAAGQTCPQGTLGSAITTLERQIEQCGQHATQLTALDGRLARIEWRMDQLVTDQAEFDRLLAAFRAEVERQTASAPVADHGQSDWPIILGVAALVLGASALYVALNHHHEVRYVVDETTGKTITLVIPRPTEPCWPPGHCKRDRSGK